MALMRHSDRRLTDKIYTDENLLGTWAAFDALSNYAERASQILVANGQSVTSPVATSDGKKEAKATVNIGESHVLTLPVTSSQNLENGGSGGARTRHKSNNDGPFAAAPSQIASQKPVSPGHDLSRVVAAWSKLPSPFKAAILAIVNSVEGQP